MPDWRDQHFKTAPKPAPPKPRRWPKVLLILGLPIVAAGSLSWADHAGMIDVQATARSWFAKASATASSVLPAEGTSATQPAAGILDEPKGTGSPKDGAAFVSFDSQPDAQGAPARPTTSPATAAKRASLERGINLISRELAPVEADIAWRTEQLAVTHPYHIPPTAAERELIAADYIKSHPHMAHDESRQAYDALVGAQTDQRNHRVRIKEQTAHRDSLSSRRDNAKAELDALP